MAKGYVCPLCENCLKILVFPRGARENVVVISEVIGLFACSALVEALMTQVQMQLESPMLS
jgi:predicted metal-binding protein